MACEECPADQRTSPPPEPCTPAPAPAVLWRRDARSSERCHSAPQARPHSEEHRQVEAPHCRSDRGSGRRPADRAARDPYDRARPDYKHFNSPDSPPHGHPFTPAAPVDLHRQSSDEIRASWARLPPAAPAALYVVCTGASSTGNRQPPGPCTPSAPAPAARRPCALSTPAACVPFRTSSARSTVAPVASAALRGVARGATPLDRHRLKDTPARDSASRRGALPSANDEPRDGEAS